MSGRPPYQVGVEADKTFKVSNGTVVATFRPSPLYDAEKEAVALASLLNAAQSAADAAERRRADLTRLVSGMNDDQVEQALSKLKGINP